MLHPKSSCEISWIYLYFRDQDNEPPPPLPEGSHLAHDFLLEIPGENQKIIRSRFLYFLGRQDRNPGAGEKKSLLVGIPVDGVFDKIGPDSAVVQQGVSLGWGAVGGNRPPPLFFSDHEFQDVSVGFVNHFGKRQIPAQVSQTAFSLLDHQIP